jgi:hypothetical protein
MVDQYFYRVIYGAAGTETFNDVQLLDCEPERDDHEKYLQIRNCSPGLDRIVQARPWP